MNMMKNKLPLLRPKIIVLTGLPNSGKTTLAHALSKIFDFKIISTDKIRQKNKWRFSLTDGRPFDIMEYEIEEASKNLQNIIVDCCNMSNFGRYRILRAIWLENSDKYEKIAVYLDCSYKTCLQREKNKRRTKANNLIKKWSKYITRPSIKEGFDIIIIFKSY